MRTNSQPAHRNDEPPLLALAFPYALDAVGSGERLRVTARLRVANPHTQRAFEDAVAEVHETMAVAAAATAAQPPDALRDRVLAAVAMPQRSGVVVDASGQLRWKRIVAAAAAVATLVAGSVAVVTVVSSHQSQQQTTQQAIDAAADRRVVTVDVTGGGTMTVTYSRDVRAATVRLDGVAALPAGRAYQLWSIADATRSAGVLNATEPGRTVTDMGDPNAFAISVEPAAGSAAPTTTPIAVAELS